MLPASGASEAIALAKEYPHPIDVLVTDVVMPRRRGRALRDALRACRPDMPVLYVSGYAGAAGSDGVLEDGAMFLAKPFTAAALAQKVRRVLRRERVERHRDALPLAED